MNIKLNKHILKLFALEDEADVAGAKKLREEYRAKHPKEVWNISTPLEKDNSLFKERVSDEYI